jgi:hypothetical protein
MEKKFLSGSNRLSPQNIHSHRELNERSNKERERTG